MRKFSTLVSISGRKVNLVSVFQRSKNVQLFIKASEYNKKISIRKLFKYQVQKY